MKDGTIETSCVILLEENKELAFRYRLCVRLLFISEPILSKCDNTGSAGAAVIIALKVRSCDTASPRQSLHGLHGAFFSCSLGDLLLYFCPGILPRFC